MSKKQFIREIDPNVNLYRYDNGIAIVENGTCGVTHSCHPNIHKTGSVRGMISKILWNKGDRVLLSGNFKYNIDIHVSSDKYDEIASNECQCESCISNRKG